MEIYCDIIEEPSSRPAYESEGSPSRGPLYVHQKTHAKCKERNDNRRSHSSNLSSGKFDLRKESKPHDAVLLTHKQQDGHQRWRDSITKVIHRLTTMRKMTISRKIFPDHPPCQRSFLESVRPLDVLSCRQRVSLP